MSIPQRTAVPPPIALKYGSEHETREIEPWRLWMAAQIASGQSVPDVESLDFDLLFRMMGITDPGGVGDQLKRLVKEFGWPPGAGDELPDTAITPVGFVFGDSIHQIAPAVLFEAIATLVKEGITPDREAIAARLCISFEPSVDESPPTPTTEAPPADPLEAMQPWIDEVMLLVEGSKGLGFFRCWADKNPRFHCSKEVRASLASPMHFNLPPVEPSAARQHLIDSVLGTDLPRLRGDAETGEKWHEVDRAGDLAWVPLRFGLAAVDIDFDSGMSREEKKEAKAKGWKPDPAEVKDARDAVVRKIGMEPWEEYPSSEDGTHLIYPFDVAEGLRVIQRGFEFEENGKRYKGDIRLGKGYVRIPRYAGLEAPRAIMRAWQRRSAPDFAGPFLPLDRLVVVKQVEYAPTPERREEIRAQGATSPQEQVDLIAATLGLVKKGAEWWGGTCPECNHHRSTLAIAAGADRVRITCHNKDCAMHLDAPNCGDARIAFLHKFIEPPKRGRVIPDRRVRRKASGAPMVQTRRRKGDHGGLD